MAAEVFPRRTVIGQRQFEQLRELLRGLTPSNPFYTAKYDTFRAPSKIARLHDYYDGFPFTTKDELVADQAANPPYGTNFTYPLERYTRCHQTSGTSGRPLYWLDTPESWDVMLRNWQIVLRAAGVVQGDTVFFAFSFGPFLGFWLAFEAALQMGCRSLPGGGLSSVARVRVILDHGVTVLCCTPTYALHLAEVAAKEGIDLSTSRVRTILVAGEPGGSVPAVRERIASLWPGARVCDHHGMTETGPVTFECPVRPGVLHVMESSFFPEVIDPTTAAQLGAGDTGELVLTTLSRSGSPLLRYRTGDLVKTALDGICECGRGDLALEGGILGRVDDMVVVRGVNVYPSALEQILRARGDVAEYQVRVVTREALTELELTVEPSTTAAVDATALAAELESALQIALSLRVPVTIVPAGTLPRFEMKAKRWLRES